MISDEELIIRSEKYNRDNRNRNLRGVIDSIINTYQVYKTILPNSHTILTAFCIQNDIREAQYKGKLPQWL